VTIPDRIGKYQFERRLGNGGMAEVYLANTVGAEGFRRQVAIKRVLPGFSNRTMFSSLFVREARLTARLTHPNVVSVLDFDRDPEAGFFLVMEFVDGRDLQQLLATGLLPIPVTIYLVTEILRGLGYAHDVPIPDQTIRGLIHRDVSPHNVLLSWEGSVKVSDFGVAKTRASCDANASTVVKGKAGYMSPEQANGQPVDGRADLFAVGVMLWEMLVGQSLFPGSTLQETLASVFFAPIPSPRQMRSDIANDIAAVALRLLERDLERRYANAEDAIRDLVACADMPRDGRLELMAIMETRFPGQTPARSLAAASCAGLTPRDPTPAPALADIRRRLGGMTPPCGLSMQVPRASGPPWLLLALLAVSIAIAAASTLALITSRAFARQPSEAVQRIGRAVDRPKLHFTASPMAANREHHAVGIIAASARSEPSSIHR
jgi:serine/threonine protein kinase